MRPIFNDPGFVHAILEAIEDAGQRLEGGLNGAHIVYVSHSIPDTMQAASAVTGPGYREQHEDVKAPLIRYSLCVAVFRLRCRLPLLPFTKPANVLA